MADEELPEVVVDASALPARKIKKPPSAWKVGLVSSIGAGPIAGTALGLIQHFRNKSYYEDAAREEYLQRGEQEQLRALVDKEYKLADPDEQRVLDYARGLIADGKERIAAGDYKIGNEMIGKAREFITGIMQGDIQNRKQEAQAQNDFQRGLIGDAAKGYRNEFQATRDALRGAEHSAQKVLELVAMPDFDPNKPLNKAHLAELMSMGGLMFKDSPDLMDGLTEGVSALSGVAGGLVGGVATMMKSKDFKVTPEDYNRLALNMQKYARLFAAQKMDELGRQASALDNWGKKLGAIPEDYSLGDYVSGTEKELKFNPNPNFTGGFQYKDEPGRGVARQAPRMPTPTNTVIGSKSQRVKPLEFGEFWDIVRTGQIPATRRPTN